jgi:microcystin-dependent protein
MRGRRLGFFLVGIVASSGVRAVDTGVTGTGEPVPTMQPSTTVQCLLADQGTYSSEGAGGAPAGGVPMLAEIRLFAGSIVPGGFHRPEGQLLPIGQNIALFTIFGTTYGGNGVSTFAYPDLRGRAIAGKGSRPGVTPRALGEPFGSENVTVGLTELPPHRHAGPGGTTGFTGGGFPLPTWQPSLAIHPVISTVEAFESPGYLPEIRFFAGAFQPGPWQTCDGRLLSTDDYPELYAAIGAAFGGDGVSTFALPDLRDAVAVGAGAGPGLPPRVLNEYAGLELFYLTSNQMAGHAHTLATGTTGTAGSGQAFENHQPSVALRFAIAVQGVYPSSDGFNFSEIPTIGEVRLFASNGPLPTGWLFAEGQVLSIAPNTVLYSVLGNAFGGNGSSTFALPDLRGRTPICLGQGVGLTSRTLGQMVGTPTTALTEANLAPHAHVVDPANTRRPGEATQLRLGKEPGDPSKIYLYWGDGCPSGVTSYAVYEGTLGAFASHAIFNGACGVADTSLSLQTPCPGSCYYLVSAVDDPVGEEGSLGRASWGAEIARPAVPCRLAVDTATCN